MFTMWSNHYALKRVVDIVRATDHLERWALHLSEFESDRVLHSRRKHPSAEALLRLKPTGNEQMRFKTELQFCALPPVTPKTRGEGYIFAQQGKVQATPPAINTIDIVTDHRYKERRKTLPDFIRAAERLFSGHRHLQSDY